MFAVWRDTGERLRAKSPQPASKSFSFAIPAVFRVGASWGNERPARFTRAGIGRISEGVFAPRCYFDPRQPMTPITPENNRRSGLCYAVAADGVELPVIDITHPAFALPFDEAAIPRMLEEFIRSERRRARMPRLLQRILIRLFLGRSYLGRGLIAGAGGVLDSMTMYVAKLGPENLGSYAKKVDRRIAGALPVRLTRIRLGDMAELLKERLTTALRARPAAPLHLLNIAGGPGADSWNALLLLKQEQLLAGRAVSIAVLDQDGKGPLFGARAIESLKQPGAPFAGLDVRFRQVAYDWNHPEALATTLSEANAEGAVVGVSSEGGLFEYGTDQQVVGNLEALARAVPADSVVVGSVTRARGSSNVPGMFKLHPRTREAFEALARSAGWVVARVIERPFAYNVALRRPGA